MRRPNWGQIATSFTKPLTSRLQFVLTFRIRRSGASAAEFTQRGGAE